MVQMRDEDETVRETQWLLSISLEKSPIFMQRRGMCCLPEASGHVRVSAQPHKAHQSNEPFENNLGQKNRAQQGY